MGEQAISYLISKCKATFAPIAHKHTAEEIGAASSSHNHDSKYDAKGSASVVQDELDDHTGNANIHFTATERTKLNGIETGAQKNTITGVKGGSESSYRTGNVNITKANVGLGNVDNTSDTNKPVSTKQQAAIDGALAEAKTYVDGKIDAVIGEGAAATLDTIGEISAAIEAHQDVTDALNSAIGNKVDKVTGKGLSANDYTDAEKSKLASIAEGAEVNQNAFSNIAVSGQTTVGADTTTDTVTFVGSNVSITTDATNDKVTFSVANGTTSARGVVQLTNSTSSTSTTTAATPNSVKSAYDLANTANTAATNAQTTADSKTVVQIVTWGADD